MYPDGVAPTVKGLDVDTIHVWPQPDEASIGVGGPGLHDYRKPNSAVFRAIESGSSGFRLDFVECTLDLSVVRIDQTRRDEAVEVGHVELVPADVDRLMAVLFKEKHPLVGVVLRFLVSVVRRDDRYPQVCPLVKHFCFAGRGLSAPLRLKSFRTVIFAMSLLLVPLRTHLIRSRERRRRFCLRV